MSNFKQRGFGRRDFMRLMGLSGASLLPTLAPRSGRAQTAPGQAPRRLLVIYGEGSWTTRLGDLKMRPPWINDDYELYDFGRNALVPDPNEWEFSFTDPRLEQTHMSKVLAPLWRHRAKMTVLEGLGLLSSGLDGHGDGHAQAHVHLLSGSPAAYQFDGIKSWGDQPSIDQRVHEHLQKTDPHLVSLDFRAWEERGGPQMFHEFLYRTAPDGSALRLTTESNPQAAFDRMFAGRASGNDPIEAAQQNVLDLVKAQHDRLLPRLGSGDRQKLQAHRELISTLQQRLQTQALCDGNQRPGGAEGLDRVALYEQDADAFAQMIAAGFSCGLARVGTLGLVYIPSEAYGLPPRTAIHHDYEHHIFLEQWFEAGGPAPDNLRGYNAMLDRNVYRAGLVAKVIDVLDAIPEGDGTLLDNTLVVFVSELSHGNHGHEDTYFILFGSGGGAIRPGRYIKYKRDNPNPYNRNYQNEYTNTPHSHLLVSIAQAFGLEMDFMPNAQSCVGSVPHLNISDVQIPLSGPLPRLA